MKTSARNQFRGKIKSVQRGAVNADVVLDIGDGLEIIANITTEAIDDLRLAPGREAVALIKASFILLSVDLNSRISARNKLEGIVSAIVHGSVNSEVKVQLAGERVLTAIVTADGLKDLDLTEGSRCCALVEASHVLMAVND